MTKILILSHPSESIESWSNELAKYYNVEITQNIPEKKVINDSCQMLIINIDALESDQIKLAELKSVGIKTLLVGKNWPEHKQIAALVAGASGYCDLTVSAVLMVKAIASVVRGEIWLERHLIPQVIGTLIQSNPPAAEAEEDQEAKKELLNSLSNRELDVAKLIRTGKSNKRIASTLFISERTVKAHLTSIFKKMQVADRLHLAISLKSFDI